VVAADPLEPDRVNIYERWESALHLDTHLAGIAQAAPSMPHVRSVEVMRYEISESSQLRG
jgi:quinol monooxygenase YgiN